MSHLHNDIDISFHEEKQDHANTTLVFLPYELNQFIKINVINRAQQSCSVYYNGFHVDLARVITLLYFKNYCKILELFCF